MCIIIAALCFSIMSAFLKLIIDQHHVLDIMFLRSFFALAILLTLYKFNFFKVKKKYFKFHFFRTIIGVSAMFFTFTALKYIPISNLTIINFSKIFFILPLAFILLKEKIYFSSIFYILIGFLGIILIIGIEVNNPSNLKYYLYALFGAFLIALVKILIKKIVARENTLNIQFWFSLYSCILLFFPYFHLAIFPSPKSILNIFFASIFGLLAQFFTIKGLQIAKSTIVMPFDFFRVIFATIIGVLIFSESITLFFLLGASLIIFSGIQLSKLN
jgi:drug/metabolite transporter (DMT)-like permease